MLTNLHAFWSFSGKKFYENSYFVWKESFFASSFYLLPILLFRAPPRTDCDLSFYFWIDTTQTKYQWDNFLLHPSSSSSQAPHQIRTCSSSSSKEWPLPFQSSSLLHRKRNCSLCNKGTEHTKKKNSQKIRQHFISIGAVIARQLVSITGKDWGATILSPSNSTGNTLSCFTP